jgi:hypothetical protein
MSHLKPVEIVDAVEGVLAPDRRAHARDCASCRAEIARAAEVFADVRAAGDGPRDPSPLFWDHFPARVRDAIDRRRPGAWGGWRLWVPAAATTVLLAFVLMAALDRARPSNEGPTTRASTAAAPSASSTDVQVSLDGSADADWTLVADMANELAWDDAAEAGWSPRPGAADTAMLQLSDDQRQELVRLIEAEIDRLKVRS